MILVLVHILCLNVQSCTTIHAQNSPWPHVCHHGRRAAAPARSFSHSIGLPCPVPPARVLRPKEPWANPHERRLPQPSWHLLVSDQTEARQFRPTSRGGCSSSRQPRVRLCTVKPSSRSFASARLSGPRSLLSCVKLPCCLWFSGILFESRCSWVHTVHACICCPSQLRHKTVSPRYFLA